MNQCKMERIPQMKEVIGTKADSLMNVRLKYIENLLVPFMRKSLLWKKNRLYAALGSVIKKINQE